MVNNTDRAIELMNEYGRIKKPFLFIIDFEKLKPIVLPVSQLKENDIFFSINDNTDPKFQYELIFKKYPIDYDVYKNAFEYVSNQIANGYSYLTNLTFPTRIDTNLTLQQIFKYSNAKYKLLVGDKFVVFSPECFIKIAGGIISSYPMKGTIDASIPNAEQVILNDEKELAEHYTIVDLIRNDLSIVASDVSVEKFRYIEKITTNDKSLLQVSSKITGRVGENFNEHLGDIIFAMLPAGSISGAPKKKTVEIIKEAEKNKRGYYTGVFGYYDGEMLDSAVMIRFIENTSDGMFYRSGGGITFMSNSEIEYNELIDKVYVPVNRSN